jgi:hypothetical protein
VEIFAAQCALPVSPDSSGEFAAGEVDIGGKFMTPAANLPPMSLTPVVHLEFSKKFEITIISVAWVKRIHEKTLKQKFRDTVLLILHTV